MNLNTPTPDKGNKLFSEIFWLLSLNLQKTCGTGKSLDELKFSQVFVIDLFIFLCSALIIEHFSFVRWCCGLWDFNPFFLSQVYLIDDLHYTQRWLHATKKNDHGEVQLARINIICLLGWGGKSKTKQNKKHIMWRPR